MRNTFIYTIYLEIVQFKFSLTIFYCDTADSNIGLYTGPCPILCSEDE